MSSERRSFCSFEGISRLIYGTISEYVENQRKQDTEASSVQRDRRLEQQESHLLVR